MLSAAQDTEAGESHRVRILDRNTTKKPFYWKVLKFKSIYIYISLYIKYMHTYIHPYIDYYSFKWFLYA